MIKNRSIINFINPYGHIYEIRNKVNNKRYIGQTINKKGVRGNMILNSIKKIYWWNNHLLNSIKKYGFENFERNIIDSVKDKEELDEKEDFYIRKYNTINSDYGYNHMYGGSSGKHTIETKEKMSEKTKKRYEERPEIKEKISESMKKYYKENPVSEETKKKLSEALKGKKAWNEGLTKEDDKRLEKCGWARGLTKETDERVKKISKSHKGKKLSEEHINKISNHHKNNPNSGEFKKGNIPWNKGMKGVYKLSEETRKKLSEKTKGKNNPNYKHGRYCK